MRTLIDQIPEGNYIGYYWLSDAEAPVTVQGNFPLEAFTNPLPFIVEGNLLDKEQNRSISIRHNGERHVIQQYDLSQAEGFEKNEVSYITHQLPGKGKAKFWELWREEEDPLCASMRTLRPYGRVFVGFEND